MAKKEIVIRHTMDDILACYDDNKYRNPILKPYYLDDRDRNAQINANLLMEMKMIIKSRTDNIDPNDSSLITYIREYLNKVCASNIDEIINKLKLLNYSTQKHFEVLAKELIIKAMNDAMAYRGLESKELTTSQICVKIAGFFYQFCLTEENVKFGSILGQECSQHFRVLTHVTKENNGLFTAFMNKNNQQRINNYKAFVNLIGLLYVSNLFPAKIILTCLTTIKKLILQSNLSQEECDNYFGGYDKLMIHIVSKFNSELNLLEEKQEDELTVVDKAFIGEFFTVFDEVDKLNEEITQSIEKNSKNTDTMSAEKNNTIRKYSVGIHKLNVKKIKELRNKYDSLKQYI